MYEKALDHLYHRSRVDAQITGNIMLVGLLAVLAIAVGDRFEPMHPSAKLFDTSRLVWVENESGWIDERKLIETGNFPPASNHGTLDVREIQPISISIILAIGTFAAAYFLYTSARRQTRLMNAVYSNDPAHPYQRPWEEIRITFWALDIVLAFIVFYLIS
ncbi:MAG TPA: hypothetical protein P5572_10225 [Phycisphaerae bacterium]|nr:hypothetical protein [Phycisphaerae bacterium]